MCHNFRRFPVILHFRRFLSQVAEHPETNNECLNNLSTLFVPGRYGGEMYQIVKPTIDLEYLIQNSERIQRSCEIRNIKLDMLEIINYGRKWHALMEKKDNLSREIQALKNDEKSTEISDKNNLIDNKKVLLNELTDLKRELYVLDDTVIPLFAKIPNIIHDDTPEIKDISKIMRKNNQFSFQCASHVNLAKSISCLEFSNASPTAYYLMGKLSILEQAVQSFFEEQLENKNFMPILGIDFAKSFIFEAGGKDPYSINDCIMLQREKKEIGQRSNLVGGSSAEIFWAYFVNMNINKSLLPSRYYSFGRFYDASHRQVKASSLFHTVQSNRLHCCIVSEPSHNDLCFDELYDSLVHCYSLLDLPYRIVYVSAKNLNRAESRKIRIELWSPFEKKYITCSDIIQCDNFVSKRLQMTYGIDHQKEGYVNFVHGFAVNIQVLLGCLIENMQQADSTFSIPNVLKEYMLESM